MATWFSPSYLFLVALLSWNVLCFPAKKGWRAHDPYEGSFSNKEVPSGPDYASFQGAPMQPSSVSYPSYNPAPDVSSVAMWNSAPAWDPVEESTTSYTASRSSGLLPPPPQYQAGDLEHYEENFAHGNSERETEEPSFMPPPYPGHGFQAGELRQYESIYDHGNEERETEEQGFMPVPQYASAQLEAEGLSEEGPKELVSQDLRPVGLNQYYLFLTGQLPPGTYSNYQSDYETGQDHWNEDHYRRYQFPIRQPQTKELPSDHLLQHPQHYTKV